VKNHAAAPETIIVERTGWMANAPPTKTIPLVQTYH